MNQAEIICTLLIVVAALAMLAKKVALPYPVLLVIGGLALGFVPGLPAVQLEPDMVFLFLLPPLLYPVALCTSWRDFSRELEPHLATGDRTCLGYDGFCGRGRACANCFALAGCVCSRCNYFAYGCGSSNRSHGSPARAAKNRHRLGWRESRQRRNGACRLPLCYYRHHERKFFSFRSKRALCSSRFWRHRNWIGCRLARCAAPASARRSANPSGLRSQAIKRLLHDEHSLVHHFADCVCQLVGKQVGDPDDFASVVPMREDLYRRVVMR